MGTTKRRLPVLKSEPEEETRPPWQWVGFGVVMVFTAWVPLAYVGTILSASSEATGSPARLVMGTLLPLATATAAGGFLVGRFGKPAGVREALLAGAVTGLVAVGLTALSASFSPLSFAVVVLAALFAGAGGAAGVRLRK